MPAPVEWYSPTILVTTWQKTLTNDDLLRCFTQLARHLEQQTQDTHVLFDIQEAGFIPVLAPFYALRSGFLRKPMLQKVAVVSLDMRARQLASVAEAATQKEISFFPTQPAALEHLGYIKD